MTKNFAGTQKRVIFNQGLFKDYIYTNKKIMYAPMFDLCSCIITFNVLENIKKEKFRHIGN